MSRTATQRESYNAARRKAALSPEAYARNYEVNHRWRRNPANKEALAASYKKAGLKRHYNLSLAEWKTMFDAQGRRCANPGCRSENPGRKTGHWCTDHDHITGKVRGILCTQCNSILGHAWDDPSRLLGAVKYLEDKGAI